MSQTTWSGPLASGDRNAGESGGPNIGLVALSQTALINFDATLVQNATFNIPASSQIVDFYVDVLTAYDSASSATLSAGTASGGVLTFSGFPKQDGADASGTAAAARIRKSDNTDIVTGLTVGTSAADIILDNTNIAETQVVIIQSAAITHA